MAKDTAEDKDGMGMSRSQLVAEHLPLLRRYARALTGNQASGDAYVGAMLEALLKDQRLPGERRGNSAPLPREAFLLLSLEGCAEEEVGFILDKDVAETRKLADTAGREM